MPRDKAPESSDDEFAPAADGQLQTLGGRLRLFVDVPLQDGAKFAATADQAHYLLRVMRAHAGERILVFNGADGEWQAQLCDIDRRGCKLQCETRVRAQQPAPDLWLAFAPIKKTPADYVLQKATELGVKRILPVLTHRTVVRRVNLDRMRANAIEAAEQSGRLCVPELCEPMGLDVLLRDWPPDRRLIFCDESGEAPSIAEALKTFARDGAPWGVLVGPEGGFDEQERAAIRASSFALPVSLGPRIMRADTAALAALAVCQALCGDWDARRLVTGPARH